MPKTVAVEQLVPVVEIADELGIPLELVITLLDREGAELLEDWRGRPAVPGSIAKAVVERRRADVADHERREQERLAREAEWEMTRQRVWREAYDEALERLAPRFERGVRQGFTSLDAPPAFFKTSPGLHARAREEADAALARWLEENPRP